MKTLKTIYDGVWPVMLIPFHPDRSIDWNGLDELVEYYVLEGVAGLFPVSTSSEIFDLTPDERFQIARHVSQRANGRINVVATGNWGETLDEQHESICSMQETGVDAVIISTSFLPNQKDLRDEILELSARATGPLGIYEMPLPTHRLLSPDDVEVLAQTERFVFLKETSRDVPQFMKKVNLSRNTSMKIFQANLASFFRSGINVGAGFTGCAANSIPRLLVSYLNTLKEDQASPKASRLARLIMTIENVINSNKYPASSKFFLSRMGVGIESQCRWEIATDFDESNMKIINQMIQALEPCIASTNEKWRHLMLPDDFDLDAVLEPWKDFHPQPPID